MENGNKPAYPYARSVNKMDGNGWVKEFYAGLTKREIFAAMAMQGLIAANYSDSEGNARSAVHHADALLKALEQDQPQKAS